jgi:hypothetical protein
MQENWGQEDTLWHVLQLGVARTYFGSPLEPQGFLLLEPRGTCPFWMDHPTTKRSTRHEKAEPEKQKLTEALVWNVAGARRKTNGACGQHLMGAGL